MASDKAIENALRKTVRSLQKAGEEITVNAVRQSVSKQLDLDNLLTEDKSWKSKSKQIIQDEFSKEEAADEPAPEPEPEPEPESKKPAKKIQNEDIKPKREGPTKKRKSVDMQAKQRKKTKEDSDVEDISMANTSEPEAIGSATDTKARKPTKPGSKSAENKTTKAEQVSSDNKTSRNTPEMPEDKDEDTTSSMSDVIDEPPPKRKGSSAKTEGSSKSTKSRSTTIPVASDDPDQAEIKKLQGQLAKCGVRKVWGAYLKPYETSRAKIKHLREMLVDVGMTGRFSNERAAEIKERRELQADLNDVQEGEEAWGIDGGTKKGRAMRSKVPVAKSATASADEDDDGGGPKLGYTGKPVFQALSDAESE